MFESINPADAKFHEALHTACKEYQNGKGISLDMKLAILSESKQGIPEAIATEEWLMRLWHECHRRSRDVAAGNTNVSMDFSDMGNPPYIRKATVEWIKGAKR